MVVIACICTFILWVAGASTIGLAAIGATRNVLTRFESVVVGLSVAAFAPVVFATWAWFLPLGRYGGILAGALMCLGVGVVSLRRAPVPLRSLRPTRSALLAGIPVVAFVLAIAGVSLYAALLKPVDEWDALMYHGPTTANLLSHGSLFGWESPVPYVFYPSLGAVAAGMFATVSHSSNVLDAVQVPYVILLALICWAWAGFGRVRILPGAIVCAVIVNPAVYGQLRALYIDVVFTAAMLAGMWLTWLWWSRGRPRVLLLLAGGGIGAAAASKPSGLVMSVAWLALVGAALLWRRDRGFVRTGLGAAGMVALAGGAFYVRNLIEFHNPVYPVQVEVPGKTFYGTISWSNFYNDPAQFKDTPRLGLFFQNLWYSASDPPFGMTHDVRVGGFGRSVIVVGLLALAAVLTTLVRHRWSEARVAIGAPLIAMVVYLMLQPQSWYPRYSIVAYALVAIAAARLIEPWNLRPRAAATLGLLLLGTWGLVARDVESRLWHGIARLHHYAEERPAWDESVTGSATAFENSYEFLRHTSCGQHIVVESSPKQEGLFSTFSLGLYGNGLCNHVRVVEWGDDAVAPDGSDVPHLRELVEHSRYVVVRATREPVIDAIAAQMGADAVVVGKNHPFGGLAAVPQVAIEIRSRP